MRTLIEAASAALLSLFLCAAAPEGLDTAATRYFSGDLEGAATAYEEVLADGSQELGPGARYEALSSLAAVRAELGQHQRALVPLTEALALADLLAADGTWAEAPIAARMQLAETLHLAGQHRDAEAAAWDLLDHTIASQSLPMSSYPIRLILLSAVAQGAKPAQLSDLMIEWDVTLGGLDAYRLANPPPPEPILTVLDAMSQDYVTQGAFAEARALLEAILALDEARGATFRLARDHSQIAFVALQSFDLEAAEAALGRAEALQGDGLSIEVLASRSAIAFEYGDRAQAADLCSQAIAAAEAQGDVYRQAVLRGRLGRLRGTPVDHEFAATLYDQMSAPGEAAQERALAALAGPVDGSRAAYAEAIAALGDVGVPPAVRELGLLIDHRALATGAVPADDFDATLAAVQKGWFELEEPERLMEAILLQVDRTVAEGGDVAAAADAVEALQEQVGLELEGWYAAYAHGLAASGDERIAFWIEAARRYQWTWDHGIGWPRTAGEPTLLEPRRVDVREELLRALVAAGRHEEAVALFERIIRLMGSPPQPRVAAGRRQMREVSFRGGERLPSDVRAEIKAWLDPLIVIDELPPVPRTRPGTLGIRAFVLDGHVRIYLVPPEGEVEIIAAPSVEWLERIAAHRPKKRKKADEHWLELGHLFGRVAARLDEAEVVYWAPAGPFRDIPFGEVPVPGNKTMDDITTVRTTIALSAPGVQFAPR
ncbi:MAG: hypothetical protein GY898_15220 [Proteobacteria bacterium]|nr:hypothetical protein [Pseudomonadota bacterium]